MGHDGGAYAREEASKVAAKRLLTKLGSKVEQLDRFATEAPSGDYYITEVRFKVRYDTVGDVLGIIKIEGENGKQIAFHSDDTISEALGGMVNRLVNGTLKWKEDIPYDKANVG